MLKTADVVRHFGTKAAIAEELDISSGAVSQWGEFVPPLQASRLHAMTRGVLKYDPAAYAGWYSRKRAAVAPTA